MLVMKKQGYSIRRIARECGVSRNTVRKYLRSQTWQPYPKRKSGKSILDPYKAYLQKRIEFARPNWIPATVLFREIVQRGYPGKISLVRQYIRLFKEKKPKEEVIRFETQKGQQMQIDFTQVRYQKHRFKVFVATLGYSRSCYVEFFDHEKASSWEKGIVHACRYFGGVPKELLFDNAKSLVVDRNRYGKGNHRFSEMLLHLSRLYGFRLIPCRPYRARTKGKVERFHHYLKHSFIVPLMSLLKERGSKIDVDILNAKVGPWLEDEANRRIHGTTMKRPCDLLEEERPHLMDLPERQLPFSPKDKVGLYEELQPCANIFNGLLGSLEGFR